MKEYAAQSVLKGMVDRLETSEAGEPSPEFRRGAIACAASTITIIAREGAVDDVYETIAPFVEKVCDNTPMSQEAFDDLLSAICENHL